MLLTEITLGGPNFLLLTAPEWSLPIPPICLSGQSQPSSMCVHHAALVLNLPYLLLNSWKSNGRVLGGRRLLYASEKEQSMPAEGSSTTVLQNMYIPRLSCHPRFLCSCRLIDYSILLLKRKKQAKKKSKPPLSFLLSFSLSLQFVQGDGELFCQNLNGKRNKPTTSLPFITGCFVLNSQNHRDSIVWPKHLMPKFDVKVMIWFPALFLKVRFCCCCFFFPFAFTCLLPPFETPKNPFQKHHKSKHRSKWNRKLLHPSFFMLESTVGGNGRKLDLRALRTSHRVVFSVICLGFSQLAIDTFHT